MLFRWRADTTQGQPTAPHSLDQQTARGFCVLCGPLVPKALYFTMGDDVLLVCLMKEKKRSASSLCWHSAGYYQKKLTTIKHDVQWSNDMIINLLEPFRPFYVWECQKQRTQKKMIFINLFVSLAYFSLQVTFRVTLRELCPLVIRSKAEETNKLQLC